MLPFLPQTWETEGGAPIDVKCIIEGKMSSFFSEITIKTQFYCFRLNAPIRKFALVLCFFIRF